MFRKAIALGVTALMLTGVLAGCSTATKPNDNGAGNGNGSGNAKEVVIRYNMGAEPRYLDPALATDTVSFSATMQLNEGLVRIGEKGVEPGIAKTWKEEDGGSRYIFNLNEKAKFSNGDTVTAEDVVFSWTRALDPRLASEYAYQLYYIKGGQELNSLDPGAADFAAKWDAGVKNLGVKALDAKTVEVTLAGSAPYFVSLTAFGTLNIVSKKVVEANKDWAASAETYVGAGPFKLTKWAHKEQIEMVKNEHYWDKDTVKVDKLLYYMVEEQGTFLNMFETGQLDVTEQPNSTEAPRLLKENKLKVGPLFGTYYLNFNNSKAPFDNPKVRKALSMAIDRNSIVTNIMRAGQKPAYSLVAPGSPDVDASKDFRDVGGPLFKEDLAEAKKLLAEAGYPDGKGFPEVTYLYNTREDHKAIGEAVIEMWKKNLGITSFKMENTEWKVVLDRRQAGDYQLARSSWIGDYADAMTFMDLYVTDGGNNDIFWSNKNFDKLIAEVKTTADPKVRMSKMHEAEKIFMDEMPIIPIFYYNNQYLQNENITGVIRSPLAGLDFKWAVVK